MHCIMVNFLTRDEEWVFSSYAAGTEENAAKVAAEAAEQGIPSYYLVPRYELPDWKRRPFRRVEVAAAQ